MARKTLVILEDDLTGGEADETVSFSFDGVSYEIDLSTKNADKLRGAVEKYIAAARRTGGRSVKGRTAVPAAKRERTQAIREWAKTHGLDVNDRGRVPASIVAQYESAQR